MKSKSVFRISSVVLGMVVVLGLFVAASKRGGSADQHVTRIAGAQFDAEVLKAAQPVVVDFYATWCGPCRMLAPRLDEIAGSFTNKIKFVKVDVDEAPAIAKQFNIEGIPTLIFFKGGKVTDTIVGLPETSELRSRIASLAGR